MPTRNVLRIGVGQDLPKWSQVHHFREHAEVDTQVIESPPLVRVIIGIENRSYRGVCKLVEDARLLFGRGDLLLVDDLGEPKAKRLTRPRMKNRTWAGVNHLGGFCRNVRVKRLDLDLRVVSNLLQPLDIGIDVLAALKQCMVDTAIFLPRRVREPDHVESVRKPAKAQISQFLQIEGSLTHRILGNTEKGGVEFMEPIVCDASPPAGGHKAEQAMLVLPIADVHGVDNDVLPSVPQRSSFVVIVGPDGKLILEPQDDIQHVLVVGRDASEDAEANLRG